MTVDEFVSALRGIDSATVSNAIEGLGLRDKTEGYVDLSLRCLLSQAEPMVGFAVPIRIDSTTPGLNTPPAEAQAGFQGLLEAIAASPQPSVLVVQEAGPNPDKGCHGGDVLATAVAAHGCVGVVSGSGYRDLPGTKEAGLTIFARGLTVSHGVFTITQVNVPVEVCGLSIQPGDLLHGDENGVVVVPTGHEQRLLELVDEVRTSEAAAIARFRGMPRSQSQ
jgi:4-hydroxy-4-methyl-2-oxoglutarate aldolase